MLNKKGFTLIELIAVMLILGILATAGLIKFDVFNSFAKRGTMILTIEELNKREKMNWFDTKLGDEGYIDDLSLFNIIDYDLGRAKWVNGPKPFGGTLSTDGGNAVLVRTASTKTQPASWRE
jgi:prepilin-type N-terminal cleavage/methylation domain-containing protein